MQARLAPLAFPSSSSTLSITSLQSGAARSDPAVDATAARMASRRRSLSSASLASVMSWICAIAMAGSGRTIEMLTRPHTV